jgi:hypothetical protein
MYISAGSGISQSMPEPSLVVEFFIHKLDHIIKGRGPSIIYSRWAPALHEGQCGFKAPKSSLEIIQSDVFQKVKLE